MPHTSIEPYIFFGGRCDESAEFYRTALGAKVDMLMRYKDSPEPQPPGRLAPGYEDKVMHATFTIGSSTLMASDGCGEALNLSGFRLSLAVPSKVDAERVFAALAEGGSVQLPLTKTFWSPCFGMVTDRFGLGWMIGISS